MEAISLTLGGSANGFLAAACARCSAGMQASWYLGSEIYKSRWRGRHSLTLEQQTSNLFATVTRAERQNFLAVWHFDAKQGLDHREPLEIGRLSVSGGCAPSVGHLAVFSRFLVGSSRSPGFLPYPTLQLSLQSLQVQAPATL